MVALVLLDAPGRLTVGTAAAVPEEIGTTGVVEAGAEDDAATLVSTALVTAAAVLETAGALVVDDVSSLIASGTSSCFPLLGSVSSPHFDPAAFSVLP